jgi:hypothetical protein
MISWVEFRALADSNDTPMQDVISGCRCINRSTQSLPRVLESIILQAISRTIVGSVAFPESPTP